MEEKILNECLRRMEELHLSKQCISAFLDGKIWESEGIGALYELNEEEEKIVKEFEKENGYKVYHVIHCFTEFGEIYNLLFVDNYFEEWKYFSEELKDNITYVYAYNKSYSECSEFGSIGVKSQIGGLVRTY